MSVTLARVALDEASINARVSHLGDLLSAYKGLYEGIKNTHQHLIDRAEKIDSLVGKITTAFSTVPEQVSKRIFNAAALTIIVAPFDSEETPFLGVPDTVIPDMQVDGAISSRRCNEWCLRAVMNTYKMVYLSTDNDDIRAGLDRILDKPGITLTIELSTESREKFCFYAQSDSSS